MGDPKCDGCPKSGPGLPRPGTARSSSGVRFPRCSRGSADTQLDKRVIGSAVGMSGLPGAGRGADSHPPPGRAVTAWKVLACGASGFPVCEDDQGGQCVCVCVCVCTQPLGRFQPAPRINFYITSGFRGPFLHKNIKHFILQLR